MVEAETEAGKAIVPAGTWSADPAHSSVGFKVKHPAMFATVELELEASVQGVGSDPSGSERVGLEARGQIEPRDFGIDWEQVEFAAHISAVRST